MEHEFSNFPFVRQRRFSFIWIHEGFWTCIVFNFFCDGFANVSSHTSNKSASFPILDLFCLQRKRLLISGQNGTDQLKEWLSAWRSSVELEPCIFPYLTFVASQLCQVGPQGRNKVVHRGCQSTDRSTTPSANWSARIVVFWNFWHFERNVVWKPWG